MARPKKQGLDYFPFDVDFFEDEKIAAISGEFGLKGEIVAVKLLCAIYRNGYFILWSDMLRLKILRDLPGVSQDLLDKIVDRLVRWEFFDKALFDSMGVLTSRGIQTRYFSATKRRTENSELPYLLVSVCKNPVKEEFMYAETPQRKGNNSNNTITDTTLTGSDMCDTPKRKRQEWGDCKGGESKPLTQHDPARGAVRADWRGDFEVYLSDLREAFKSLVSDAQWMSQQAELNPGIDVHKSLEKACINFWATEEGWKRKKSGKKSQTINWKLTLANAISQPFNRVYNDRKTGPDNGYRAAREAEKRAGREELGNLAAAVLSGFAGKTGR